MSADAEAILRARPAAAGDRDGRRRRRRRGAGHRRVRMRLYDGADPLIGGLSWERRPIDPVPGPRRVDEIDRRWELAPGVMLAGPRTRVRGPRRVLRRVADGRAFSAARPCSSTSTRGAGAVAAVLAGRGGRWAGDLIVFVDVGGDVLAQGDEPGLRSPLCDAVMLAVAERLAARRAPGAARRVRHRLRRRADHRRGARAAGRGGRGRRPVRRPRADRAGGRAGGAVAGAASRPRRAPRRCGRFAGSAGRWRSAAGRARCELSSVAAQTFYLDVRIDDRDGGRLARAVAGRGQPGGGQRRAQRARGAHRARPGARAAGPRAGRLDGQRANVGSARWHALSASPRPAAPRS